MVIGVDHSATRGCQNAFGYIHCSCALFVLCTFVEGVGVCLGRCVNGEKVGKGDVAALTGSFGAGRCKM